jgi:Leucine-rich repeat (LRR) protein
MQTIENIPQNCKELYLDFNEISSIKLKESHKLELLSISNNIVNDDSLNKIIQSFP